MIRNRISSLSRLSFFVPLALSACASEDSVLLDGSGVDAEDGTPSLSIATFAFKSALPACSKTNQSQVYYVSSEDQLYFCDGKKMLEIEIDCDPSWLTDTIPAKTSVCAAGGTVIRSGADINGNHELDKLEIQTTATVCNGKDGKNGLDGKNGKDGVDGADGAVGAAGPQGPAGANGQDGADGAVGAAGPQGPAGANGQDGATGGAGTSCSVHDNGDGTATVTCGDGTTANLYGPPGATGPQGPAGANGQDGATGPQGPAGANGQDGATGPQGPTGANGQDGATGPQGPAGANGQDGATGPTGADGQDGATGPQGPAGADGSSCTVTDNGDHSYDIDCTDGSHATVHDGQDGEDATPGNTLLNLVPEPKGASCHAGGVRIEIGADSDQSGALESDEVTGSGYACSPLTTINGSLTIFSDQQLAQLRGVREVTGTLSIFGNVTQSALNEAVVDLERVGVLDLNAVQGLTSFQFDKLAFANRVVIQNNFALADFRFPELESAAVLEVVGNQGLRNFRFDKLWTLSNLFVSSNPQIRSFNGFDALSSVSTLYVVTGNGQLPTCQVQWVLINLVPNPPAGVNIGGNSGNGPCP